MSSAPRPAATRSSPANLQIVPIGRVHLAGFHAAVDSVAKERRYLAMLEAPSFTRTRRLVLDSLRAGAQVVAAGRNLGGAAGQGAFQVGQNQVGAVQIGREGSQGGRPVS